MRHLICLLLNPWGKHRRNSFNVPNQGWRREKKWMFTLPEKEPRLLAQSASPYSSYYTDTERMKEMKHMAFLN
jgi:hypothetical protein